MSTAELRCAIEEPASRRKWELEPGLVEVLLHDVGSGPIPNQALPLLPRMPRSNLALTARAHADRLGLPARRSARGDR
jgi:hypothetical protein